MSKCILCGCSETRHKVTGYDRQYIRSCDYDYVECVVCGLVSLDPLPSEEDVRAFYPDDYPPHLPGAFDPSGKWVNRLAIEHYFGVPTNCRSGAARPLFKLLSRRIMKDVCEPHGQCRMLDVGCGAGQLLEVHSKLGWTACGIEPDTRAVRACQARGLSVRQGTLLDVPLEKRSFDVILMSHVIEHFTEPIGSLRRAAELLAPRGKIIIRTPNIRSIGFQLYRSCWFPLDAPRHIFLFHPRTLHALSEKSGLRPRSIKTRFDPVLLCESRHYQRHQGQVLPKEEGARALVLARSQALNKSHRWYRQLISPLALFSIVGRGEILEAQLTEE